ncbi:MAG: hypothetical protein M3536_10800, partial [Actinomycetota bacterium]|nr:hypothetical protein [Actinomycetota bacterium]
MTQAMALDDYDADWSADALATIISLARTRHTFSADDLNRELRKPPHCNMIGAAFRAAKSAGYIEQGSFTTSSTKSRRQGTLREWRG